MKLKIKQQHRTDKTKAERLRPRQAKATGYQGRGRVSE